jgi:hypothetical protein
MSLAAANTVPLLSENYHAANGLAIQRPAATDAAQEDGFITGATCSPPLGISCP